ncbi:MAG: hypothetical protein QM613_02205, partial [Micrococcaceae bacterium]
PAVAASVVFESLVFDQLTANGGSGLPDSPTPNRIFGTGDEISVLATMADRSSVPDGTQVLLTLTGDAIFDATSTNTATVTLDSAGKASFGSVSGGSPIKAVYPQTNSGDFTIHGEIVDASPAVSTTLDADFHVTAGNVVTCGRITGNFGNGNNTDSTGAMAIPLVNKTPLFINFDQELSGKTVTQIEPGGSLYFSLLTDDGLVYTIGANGSGQLGDGTTTNSGTTATFQPVTTTGTPMAGKTITQIATGTNHMLALASDGTVYAWGLNDSGQLGDNTTTNSSVPVAVTTTGVLSGKTITSISARSDHSLALASDGTVYAWGANGSGQLGNNTTTNSSVPVAVTTTGVLSGKTITDISAGDAHSLVLASDNTLYSWGNGAYGRLGRGSTTSSSVPVAVTMTGVLSGKTITDISAGNYNSYVVASGWAYAWGSNVFGSNGNGATSGNATTPVAMTSTSGPMAGKTITEINSDYSYSCFMLASDGTAYACGSNSVAAFGNGSSSTTNATPVAAFTAGNAADRQLTSAKSGMAMLA